MPQFITRIDLIDASPAEWEQMHNGMLASKFFRHITAADNTPYLLPLSTFYSEGNLQPSEVKRLAEQAASITGKAAMVLTVAIAGGQAAWTLNPVAPPLTPLGSQTESLSTGVSQLFDKLEATTDKLRPLVETTAKVSSDFGQLLIKGCTTLNAGALIAMPTFYKALAPASAPIPLDLYKSCVLFASGLILGALAGWVACIFIAYSSRMLSHSIVLPLLQAQMAFNPDSMDKIQRRRMRRGEFSNRWSDAAANWGLGLIALLSLLSLAALVAGSYYGGKATLGYDLH